ncbi:MAG: type II toxin-antitoxin system VapC family toxin [Crenarchaeota archaeon]|nr:type II toxin-antitoxin system VapC family toxin [Thermoproteota archaeon]
METIKAIIDTDILIDLLRNQNQAVAFIADLEKEKAILATTTINIFELYHGAHKSQESERNLKAINELASRLSVLPLTNKAAKKAACIYAQLEHEGKSIGLKDTFIAAITLTLNASIATRNKAHFNKISDLKIISP